jgi:hypothetical protein
MVREDHPVRSHAARVAASVVCIVLLTTGLTGQVDMAGEWEVMFTTPLGHQEFTMFIVQEGPRLTGRLTSDAGEFPLRGRLEGDEFEITWSLPDQDRILAITFKGKVEGDSIRGTARLGDRGTGTLSGSRTDR